MSLKTLTSILKSGNKALEEKLHNLLTEDCSILEYTDDSVLFQKNNYLVLAKFKHNLAESKMTAEDILDNEVIYVSAKQTDKELKELPNANAMLLSESLTLPKASLSLSSTLIS